MSRDQRSALLRWNTGKHHSIITGGGGAGTPGVCRSRDLIGDFGPCSDSVGSSHRSSRYHTGFRQPRVIVKTVASGAPALIMIIFRQLISHFSAVVHDIRPLEENCDFPHLFPSCLHIPIFWELVMEQARCSWYPNEWIPSLTLTQLRM